MSWTDFWLVFLVVSLSIYGVMAVAVTWRGAFELRALLKASRSSRGSESAEDG